MSMVWARRIRVPLPRCKHLRVTHIARCRQRHLRTLWRVLALVLLLGACSPLAPATTPAQLQHTPGPYFTITESQFDAGRFRLAYPSTWRVVLLSPANAPLAQVVFVAPDQSAVRITQVESAPASADENQMQLKGGVVLQVNVEAADGAAESFATQAARLIASIQAGA